MEWNLFHAFGFSSRRREKEERKDGGGGRPSTFHEHNTVGADGHYLSTPSREGGCGGWCRKAASGTAVRGGAREYGTAENPYRRVHGAELERGRYIDIKDHYTPNLAQRIPSEQVCYADKRYQLVHTHVHTHVRSTVLSFLSLAAFGFRRKGARGSGSVYIGVRPYWVRKSSRIS